MTRAGRGDDRRADIVAAARRVFRRDGLAGATLDAVAVEAGIPRPHLYRYVRGKAELVAAVVALETKTVNERRRRALRGIDDVGDRIVRALELAVEIVNSDELLTAMASTGNVPYTAYAAAEDPAVLASNERFWTPLLDEAAALGRLRPDLVRDDVLRWLLGVQFLFFERSEIFPPDEVARFARQFVLPGLLLDDVP